MTETEDDTTLLARGVLMCRYRVTRQQALVLLQEMADESNVPLAEVADGLLAEHEGSVTTQQQ